MLFEQNRSLVGNLISLRTYKNIDREAYKKMLSEPETMGFLKFMTLRNKGVISDESFDERINAADEKNRANNGVYLVITKKGSSDFVGCCSINTIIWPNKCAEIGMIVSKKYWGNGYAREARELLLNFCFGELGLHRLEALTDSSNIRSINNLKKFGFQEEGVLRERFFDGVTYRNCTLLGLINKDWQELKKQRV